METPQVEGRSRAFKVIIVILLVLAIVLLGVIGYFTIFGGDSSQITSIFSSEEEHTYLLEEFTVNLRTEEDNGRNYVKTQIALMYTDNKQEDILAHNTIKIRDTIITQLRILTSEELLDGENTSNLKVDLVESINTALGEDIIKDVYFSDLIVQ